MTVPSVKPDILLDLVGVMCPEILLRTRLCVDNMKPGQVVEVLSDDPMSEIDIKCWVAKESHSLLGFERKNNILKFLIQKGEL